PWMQACAALFAGHLMNRCSSFNFKREEFTLQVCRRVAALISTVGGLAASYGFISHVELALETSW
ncbi:hypothetical protein Dimus_030525, partial [Dionaea muscipula]